MRPALDALKAAMEHPTASGLAAALSALWAAFVAESSHAFWVTAVVSIVLGALDTVLGIRHAWVERLPNGTRRFNYSTLGSKLTNKVLVYTAVWLAMLAVGALLDSQMSGDKGLMIYILPAAIAGVMASVEGMSLLNHADYLTGGQLKLGFLRGLLERLREARQQEVVTVSGQALHVETGPAGEVPHG